MKIICITGIDGAGKTTLAKTLAQTLQAQGHRSVYIYGRTYPVISRLLMTLGKRTLLNKHNEWKDYQSYHAEKKKTMKHPLLAWGYSSAIYTDYYLQIWSKLWPYSLGNTIVILDRYIYDTVISDLTVHLNYNESQTDKAIAGGLRYLPSPALTMLIDLPEDVAMKRKDDVPHLDYLRERRYWYKRLTLRPEVIKLDGELPREVLMTQVLQTVKGVL